MIADKLQLEVGEPFEIENKGDIHHFRVAAIYQTGVNDIDSVRVYLKMDDARALFKKPTGASYLQVSLINRDRAREDAAEMTNSLEHRADAWQDREKSWLGVFKAFGIATAITVSVFTLIAGLAMFNTLAMIVLEKTKEIAILRSMGYTRRGYLAHLPLAGGHRAGDRDRHRLRDRGDHHLCRVADTRCRSRASSPATSSLSNGRRRHYVEAVRRSPSSW